MTALRRTKWIYTVIAVLLCFSGCGEAAAPAAEDPVPEEQLDTEVPGAHPSAASGSLEPYKAPPFLDAQFHGQNAASTGEVVLDTSAVSDGYIAVSAFSPQRLKFQVLKDGTTYNYDIDSGGTPSIFPLQSGDGQYTFRVMENITDSKYAELYAESCQVVLQDSFQPFLRPSDYVSYSQNSSCVKKAAELAKNAPDKLGLVTQVFDYVCDNVTYDKQKAASVQSGYLPDPDETLSTGKGICFDYASLAAAMLRSQGIPVKVIFGYVSPNDLYHAWNMFYTEETGWVTVDYEVKADSWNRLDLTFSANGADGTFIGDGGNYRDLYLY